MKKIIWKSYNNDESYFQKRIDESSIIKKIKNFREEKKYKFQQKSKRSVVEIEPHLPLNNFLDYGKKNKGDKSKNKKA